MTTKPPDSYEPEPTEPARTGPEVKIVSDFRAGILEEFVTVIAVIAAYAGYAIAFLGVRSIET